MFPETMKTSRKLLLAHHTYPMHRRMRGKRSSKCLTVCFASSLLVFCTLTTMKAKTLLPDWHPFKLHPQLLSSLYAQHFTTPTPIQSKAIPAAAKGKDIVGVAETVRTSISSVHAFRPHALVL